MTTNDDDYNDNIQMKFPRPLNFKNSNHTTNLITRTKFVSRTTNLDDPQLSTDFEFLLDPNFLLRLNKSRILSFLPPPPSLHPEILHLWWQPLFPNLPKWIANWIPRSLRRALYDIGFWSKYSIIYFLDAVYKLPWVHLN